MTRKRAEYAEKKRSYLDTDLHGGTRIKAKLRESKFTILKGEATLRSPGGFQRVAKGDIIFFEEGPDGSHQFYIHSDAQLVYLDIRTKANVDVCEYPDSGKINILPALDIFKGSSKVDYYTGEEDVRNKWPKEILKKE